jgi:hypothetical protein
MSGWNVDEQDSFREREIGSSLQTEDETDYSDLDSIWLMEQDSEVKDRTVKCSSCLEISWIKKQRFILPRVGEILCCLHPF